MLFVLKMCGRNTGRHYKTLSGNNSGIICRILWRGLWIAAVLSAVLPAVSKPASAAGTAPSVTMYVVRTDQGSYIAGNSFLYLTGCTDQARIVKVSSSSMNIEGNAVEKYEVPGEGRELDLTGRNAVVALSVRYRNKIRNRTAVIKNNTRVKITIQVEDYMQTAPDGGQQTEAGGAPPDRKKQIQTLVTNVLFRQVSFPAFYSKVVINGKMYKPKVLDETTTVYDIRLKPKGKISVRFVPKKGYKVNGKLMYYYYAGGDWPSGIRYAGNGRKISSRYGKGKAGAVFARAVPTGEMPEGLSTTQKRLYKSMLKQEYSFPPIRIRFFKSRL